MDEGSGRPNIRRTATEQRVAVEYEILTGRERTRGWFASIAIAIFVLTFLGAVFLVAIGHWADGKEVIALFLPAETALLGAAAGFYFGTKQP